MAPRPLPEFRPWLECLEDRDLLTAGSLDPSFGAGGRVTAVFPGAFDSAAAALVIQSDGKIVVAGSVNASPTLKDFALARYNPDGSLDVSFGVGGRVQTDFAGGADSAFDLALQSDGKIVVVGSAATIGPGGPNTDFAIARYNPDGSLDVSFGMGGRVTTDIGTFADSAAAVALQPDGKIVVVGSNNNLDFVVVRYTGDGSLDTAFAGGGRLTTDFGGTMDAAAGVVLQPDGKIVVVGTTFGISIMNRDFALARYNPDGSPDAAFGVNGLVTSNFTPADAAADVALQPNGRLVVVGTAGNPGALDFAVARYDTNGNLDAAFGTGGVVFTDFASQQDAAASVALQPDGNIVAAGTTGVSGPLGDFALARYNPNGTLDGLFGTSGRVTTDFFGQLDQGSGVALQSDGHLVVVGAANVGNLSQFALARYLGSALPVVSIAATTATALEAGLVPGVFTVTRSGTAQPVTVFYTVSGTALAGTDYVSLSGSVTFPMGVGSVPILVAPLLNAQGFCPETVVVTLSANPAYTLGAPVSDTVTLVRDPLKLYVAGLYRDVLERLPDAPGLSFWVSQLTAGVPRTQVALAFWRSPEHRGQQVDLFYRTFLKRAADPAGRDFWLNVLLTTENEADVVIAFLTSPEYTASHADDAAYVRGLYTDIFARPGSSGEISFWQQVLQQGARSRAAVASYFLSSEESFRLALDQYYEHFLGREPDAFGMEVFLAEIFSGRITPTLIVAEFLGSPEYFGRVQTTLCP
jgi:uncharacterized delta-60 repeat protein